MPLLRLTQTRAPDGRHQVEIALEEAGQPRQTVTASFPFQMSEQEQEEIRWYLEDYLQYPDEPAPTLAGRIEQRLTEIGAELFRALFHSAEDARDLWATVRAHTNETRVEVVTSVEEAASIPWELVRDPKTDAALCLDVPAFVRAQPQAARKPKFPALGEEEGGAVRILLVICRPRRDDDVPFRSVAGRLIKGLGDQARERVHLEVLRPATFESLARALREAKAKGSPYHVVHFDGHGMYAEVAESRAAREWLKRLGAILLSGPREGSHGYLLFENPEAEENLQLVDGPALGKLLAETDVPVLVLNACRSAHAELQQAPKKKAGQDLEDPHEKVRALGSLAQEVMDAGVAGVVAMRYNVYVVTAAQFVADLYGALAQGQTLGEAVTQGRKQLAAKPMRSIAFDPLPLQDWPVPVVYEAAPIQLFPKAKDDEKLRITLDLPETARADAEDRATSNLDPKLPKQPDAGFFGRDETLLALDRAFDRHSVVLLHALAGSGKTATAAEFARWYALTGGLAGGPVLFTSFEHYTPLRSVLSHFGQIFGPMLEQAGLNWSALTETAQMRDVALQVLGQVPVLWIWDNVEPVTGFPKGTESAWSAEEQEELADFLRDTRETKAKFLLTSRRDEEEWLGELPMRTAVPPMPMQERVQLAQALAEKRGRRLKEVEDWRPLLQFTRGNPLTITVLVGQALRDGLSSREQIEAFVEELRKGEAKFEDEVKEGRSRSLGASLSYGFDRGFDEADRKRLALLHLFQGFVDVDALKLMGDPDEDCCLSEVKGLTREQGMALLDRAADVGLLTSHGGGYYTIHPALPWFFRSLFEEHYPSDRGLAAFRAFVEAMGDLANHYVKQYVSGNRDVIATLEAEEANLLHARRLSRENGWHGHVISAMQGLHSLYDQTGRRAEWRRLVEEIVPDFVDPSTDSPLPGREEEWSFVTQYRVWLADEDRDWAEAEHLLRMRFNWDRQRAAEALTKPPEKLSSPEQNAIRTLAASLHNLGEIQRKQEKDDCVPAFREALEFLERIGDRAAAATVAYNIGNAYLTLSLLRDLEQAERWYRRSMELRDERDRLGRAKGLMQLGYIAWEHFKDARAADKPEAELGGHLKDAAQYYHKALKILPENDVNDLAVANMMLGTIYGDAGDIDYALPHYRKAIGYREKQGNLYKAARTRFNVAVDLTNAGRLADARDYALAALRNYETYGTRAASEIEKTKQLLADIEEALRKAGG